MHDRFLSHHIANKSQQAPLELSHANHASSMMKASSIPNQEEYADKKEILSHIKDSLDTWTTLANTAGAVTTGASFIPPTGDMQRIAERVQESEATQKGYGTLVGLVLSIIAAFIWYVRKRSQRQTSHEKVKRELNAWYSRFSIASQACQDIATIAFSFLPPVFSPFKRLIAYVVGTIAGFIAVFFTKASDADNPLFTLGKSEGWSNYMYTGSSIGSMIGAAIGALIGLLIPIPFTMPACIALFSAIGGLGGALATGAGVPIINKIFPAVNTKYRLNYAKTGALIGSTIGGIIGFVIGFFIPLPGAAAACATIGMGFGAALGAIVLAISGPAMTKKIDAKEESTWDYSTRYAGTTGDGLGTMVGYGFERLQAGSQQLASNIGTLITSTIGFAYDLWTTRKKKNIPTSEKAQQSEKTTTLPWSTRLNVFAAFGTAIGSVVGFLIGGPVGMIIGGGAGAVVGSFVGLTAGNYLYKKMGMFGDWLTNKIDSLCCDSKKTTVSHDQKKERQQEQKAQQIVKHLEVINQKQLDLPHKVSMPITIPGRQTDEIIAKKAVSCQSWTHKSMWANQQSSSFDTMVESCPNVKNRISI